MYETFYGLKERPFNLTPDPKYLYLSEKHNEARGHLLYGIKNRSGFVMITGEIGTGKTTICRNLLNQLDPDTELAFIFNPALNPVELLQKICSEFGMSTNATTVLELTEQLNVHLLEAARQGHNCVLVIDEAQNLTPQVLEQIRLLSNLETESEKLLQIILIGQPELAEKLALQELRQLNQRITARYHLKPLNEKETLQYIAYRLHIAGGSRKVQFSRSAIRAIFRFSKGTPRLINAVCDRALLIGYTKEVHAITAGIVRLAAKEVRGEKIGQRKRFRQAVRRWIPSPALVVAAILVIVIVRFFATPMEEAARELGIFNAFLTGETPAAPAPSAPTAVNATVQNTQGLEKQVADVLVNSDAARKILQRLMAPEKSGEESTGENLALRLASLDPQVSLQGAAAALMHAWNMAMVGGLPANDNPDSLVAFAQQNGLAAESLIPALEQLSAIDLPAFVRMRAADKAMWLGLMNVTATRCTLTAETGQTMEVTREAFRDHYTGEAVVLWRDPAPNTQTLFAGQSGKPVAVMKEQLRRIGRITPDNTNDIFDKKTTSAVSRLQAETGLSVDGIAGKQVRMVLSSWLGDKDTPSLTGKKPQVQALAEAVPPTVDKKEAAAKPATAESAPVSPPPTAPAPAAPPVEKPAENPQPSLSTAPEPAPLPPNALEGMVPQVKVQDLPQPEPTPNTLPPANIDTLKESTPPAPGSPPLVPHE
ncbi:MAG TPA: AAA family ATPase [Candidatus Hydrogenedentes bacterium]|nr:AAA family ATPase [Candidatus Hydrogenedentota bacterium]